MWESVERWETTRTTTSSKSNQTPPTIQTTTIQTQPTLIQRYNKFTLEFSIIFFLDTTFFQLPGGEGGDAGENWSEGDEGSVDYLGPEHGSSSEGRGEVYNNNNNRGPAYQGGFTTTNQHPNFYNADIAMYDSYQV